MILANVRHQLTRNDAQLVLQLLGRSSQAAHTRAESLLRDEGLDRLLDDPRLLAALLDARPAMQASYALFMYVIVRHAFLSVQLEDRIFADYVSAILLNFGIRGRAQQLGDADDQTYDTLADISADLDSADARRGFLARAHLGNYALWMSGMFPDRITARRGRRGGPDLDYYESMGRKGFELAATHRLAMEYGVVQLFAEAADQFGQARAALNRISDTLLFPHQSSADRLLRQVSDDVRWRLMH